MRVVLVGVLAVLLAAPCAADARTWHGRVTSFDDGDTVKVDIAGDGTHAPRRVRLTGIQAMEQTVYSNYPERRRGLCHSLEATARLEHLIRRSHRRVRLVAQHASSHAKARLRRRLFVKLDGRWRDAGRMLLAEGHALWLPNGAENATNRVYARTAQQAALRGRNLWNTTYCGAGPSQASRLRVTVNPKRVGGDLDRPGEYVRIRNLDPAHAVPLHGWWVRDSGLRRYMFPRAAVLPAGGAITVHVGHGTDTASDLFWGLDILVFEDPRFGKRPVGDGAYLFDPQGDLRAWMTYPCLVSCRDPYQDALKVSAVGRGNDERVTLRNVASGIVDLDGYRLENPPYKYVFGTNAALAPGETMTLEVEGNPRADTRLVKHWGKTKRILDDDGDVVRLETFRDVTLDCYAYGNARC
jgi:endonuclease YncB( thermonuclease family)